jgi:hypothetical protein
MNFSNRNRFPWYIEEWLKRDDYDYETGVLSATRLIAPPRQTELMRRFPDHLTCDIADRIAARYGTAIHESFERLNLREHDGCQILQENRVHTELAGQRISGKYDMLMEQEDGSWKLVDIKSTSVWNYIHDDRKEDFQMQMSILAYILMEQGLAICPTADIVYVFTDWKRSEARRGGNYPPERIFIKSLELLDPEATKAWLTERIALLNGLKDLELDQLPQCSDKELWRKADKFAVMKRGRKSAVRVFDSMEQATELYMTLPETSHYIETRRGLVARCGYCYASNVCSQYKRLKEAGDVE